jgi:hypothetical protein
MKHRPVKVWPALIFNNLAVCLHIRRKEADCAIPLAQSVVLDGWLSGTGVPQYSSITPGLKALCLKDCQAGFCLYML